MARPITVALIQTKAYRSASATDGRQSLQAGIELLREACRHAQPDFVLFSELFLTPYWCGLRDDEFFRWSETIPGETTERLAEEARRHACHILAPLFERTPEGKHYDSVAVIDPQGQLVSGSLPDGHQVISYRKVHIPEIETDEVEVHEQYYFHPGQALPVFKTEKADIGILICYDRSFPEAWRTLVLRGAEVIFVPTASFGPRRGAFIAELRTRAAENGVFVAACNRAGLEALGMERLFFGLSAVVDPFGEVRTLGKQNVGPEIVYAVLDLDSIGRARDLLPVLRDRKPELYDIW